MLRRVASAVLACALVLLLGPQGAAWAQSSPASSPSPTASSTVVIAPTVLDSEQFGVLVLGLSLGLLLLAAVLVAQLRRPTS